MLVSYRSILWTLVTKKTHLYWQPRRLLTVARPVAQKTQSSFPLPWHPRAIKAAMPCRFTCLGRSSQGWSASFSWDSWLFQEMWGFPGGSEGKESASNAGDLDPIPGWGRAPGERNGYPFQYSCLRNPTSRGVWWATVHGVAKSRTRVNN